MNVVPLTEFDSDKQFEAHFRSLPRVILEGDSDVQFFAAWFEHLLTQLDFVSAKSICGANGCTAVEPAVRQSNDIDAIPAIGIIDRDWLNRSMQWDVLFSLDDAAPAAVTAQDVITASLWEIEAYLLRPELLGRWVGLQRNPPPATTGEKDNALAKVVEECNALLHAMPYFAAAHAVGKACDVKHFRDVKHHRMAEKYAEVRAPLSGAQLATLEQIEALIAAIAANAPEEPSERVTFLLRYLDTKRLLERLGTRLGLHRDAHHALSELMSFVGARPAELETILQDAAERFENV